MCVRQLLRIYSALSLKSSTTISGTQIAVKPHRHVSMSQTEGIKVEIHLSLSKTIGL